MSQQHLTHHHHPSSQGTGHESLNPLQTSDTDSESDAETILGTQDEAFEQYAMLEPARESTDPVNTNLTPSASYPPYTDGTAQSVTQKVRPRRILPLELNQGPQDPPALSSELRHAFSCTQCGQRFTRHENLKRHMRGHADPTPQMCSLCNVACRRPDLLRRHVKRFHILDYPRLYPATPSGHASARTRSDHSSPEPFAKRLKPNTQDFTQPSISASSNNDNNFERITTPELLTGIDLYFQHFHHLFPILNESAADLRLGVADTFLSGPVACLGMLYSQDLRVQARSTSFWWELIGILRSTDDGEDDAELEGSSVQDVQYAQSWLLLIYHGLFHGNPKAHTLARQSHHDRVAKLRNVRPQTEAAANILIATYLLDLQLSAVFQLLPLLTPHDMHHPLRSSDAGGDSSHNWTSFKDVLAALLQRGQLPAHLDTLTMLTLAYAILHQIRTTQQDEDLIFENSSPFASSPQRQAIFSRALTLLLDVATASAASPPSANASNTIKTPLFLGQLFLVMRDPFALDGSVATSFETVISSTLAAASNLHNVTEPEHDESLTTAIAHFTSDFFHHLHGDPAAIVLGLRGALIASRALSNTSSSSISPIHHIEQFVRSSDRDPWQLATYLAKYTGDTRMST
ncbi:hypothetical protein PYCC9005_005725 [Savitreella phatthalungensis]